MNAHRSMRLATTCLLGLALGLGGAGDAVAKKKVVKRASACQKLKRGHKDLAPHNSRLLVVVRGDEETGRIAGCLLPRGKVRTLASWDDGLTRDWASVVATAGTFVLVEQGHGDQYGGVSRSLKRVDVKHNRTLGLSGYGCQISFGSPTGCPSGTNYGEVDMAASGAGAYEVTDLSTSTTTLQAFAPAGAFTKLADGPVDALRVTSTQITWTQGGVAYDAALPG
jgi:hypothetical protein